MLKPEAIERIKVAKKVLEEALALMDRSKSECVHCSRTTYGDWEQSQCADNVEAMIRRLGNWIHGKIKKDKN